MQRRRWTNEEDDVIEDGIAEGLTYRQIAEKLPDRTETAVSNRTHVMRTKYSRYNIRRNQTEPPEIKAVINDGRVGIMSWAACVAAIASSLTLMICIGAMYS